MPRALAIGLRSTVLLALASLAVAVAVASCRLVRVLPTDATFAQDATDFNTAAQQPAPNGTRSLASEVLFAHDEADVAAALEGIIAVSGVRRVQVRSGRHSYMAFASTTPNASVLDVSNLSDISAPFLARCHHDEDDGHADGNRERSSSVPCTLVRVGGGVRLFALYLHLAKHGLMFPGGSCPSVGVSGFVLGGGIGFFTRRFGMGVQNLFGARVASVALGGGGAGGGRPSVRWRDARAWTPAALDDPPHNNDHSPSAVEGADLLWALRGGGNNNLGVVTSLTLRVFPAPVAASWLRVEANGAASCLAALTAYEAFVFSSSSSSSSHGDSPREPNAALPSQLPSCQVTATLDMYAGGHACAIVVLSTSLSAADLVRFTQQRFVARIPNATIASKVLDAPWVTALAGISGCNSVADCVTRSARAPSLSAPERWSAMSAFVDRRLTTTASPAQLGRVMAAIAMPAQCSHLAMVIADSLGCEMHHLAARVNTSFPHAAAARYHVQILAYEERSSNATTSCRAQVERWVLAVFAAIDALLPVKASYRNYPSHLLPTPLRRYYGASLPELRRLSAAYDPLKLFSYRQGLQ